ncbi:MAG: hypothetical protein AAGF68_00425 [Pseudomonadota bacterium]
MDDARAMAAFGLLSSTFVGPTLQVGLPVIVGLEAGVATIGSTVSVSLFGAAPSGLIAWALNGVPINGANSTTLTVPDAEGAVLSVTVDGRSSASAGIHPPAPVASGQLADQSFVAQSGIETVATAADFSFTGTALYTLQTAPAGVTIDNATGLIEINTDVLEAQTTAIVVRCADANATQRFASSGFSLEITAAPDTTAPTLSALSADAQGQTGFSGSVATSEASGTLFVLISTAATEIPADVIAQGTGQTVSNAGVQSLSGGGLSPDTSYRAHILHRDAAGNDSAVLSSAPFTTEADQSATWNFSGSTVSAIPNDAGWVFTGATVTTIGAV